MKTEQGIIGRFEKGDSRYYIDPANPENVYESVTTILSATESKPQLTQWAAKLAAEFIVNRYDDLGMVIEKFGKDQAVDLVKGEAKRLRELKADIGSHQHAILEALLLDLPIPQLPEHLIDVEVDGESVDHDAISDGLLNFLTDFQVDAELAEATVASATHRYAGTLDLVGWFPTIRMPGAPFMGARGLVDCKTGANLYGSMRRQLAAYRNADEVWLDNLGNKAAMPEVDFCAVLHLRREYDRGYKLLAVPAQDDDFFAFLTAQEAFHVLQADAKLGGKALYKPLDDGTQPPPLLEDIDVEGFNRCKGKLIKAGLKSLDALAALTEKEARSIKGVGDAAIASCMGVLAANGLAFTKEA